LPASSGVTKPKPFSSLNHFTVPVAILRLPPSGLRAADVEVLVGNYYGRWHLNRTHGISAKPAEE
jgi:hypothetical protein